MSGVGSVQFMRDENGQLVVNLSNCEGFEISNVGEVTGDTEFQVGSTGDSGELGVSFEQQDSDESASIKLSNADGTNYSFSGSNFNITSQAGSASRMITMDTVASNLDLSNTSGVNGVLMSENGGYNTVQMGVGNNIYLDNGVYNVATAVGGNNTFETGTTSIGAVITGGAGQDIFKIGGSYGVLDGGAGNDTFATIGHMAEDGDENDTYSYRNVILGGGGDDTLVDHGAYNLFFGESGFDTYIGSGSNGIANLGLEEDGSAAFQSDAIDSIAFTGAEATDSSGHTYNYYDTLAQNNWSFEEFISSEQGDLFKNGTAGTVFSRLFPLFLSGEEET